MDLKTYYLGLPREERESFCNEAETTDGYMNQLINGHKRAGTGLAKRLHKASGGKVPLAVIRPDVWDPGFAA